MKTPKVKLAFDFTLGGFFLAAALFARPYDFSNAIIAGFAVIWIAGATTVLRRDF